MRETSEGTTIGSGTMQAVRLHGAGGVDDLMLDLVPIPRLQPGEALVRVNAAAITRGELEWPLDRLPAIPSYEISGVVTAIAPDVTEVAVGTAVFALTDFDRDGGAAVYAAVRSGVLVPKPASLGHVESAAVPLAALSAWQGLFDHGALREGERVLIHGAAGGVGHLATQLARLRGAHVLATASSLAADRVRELGAHEVLDRSSKVLAGSVERVDLVFDTVGGDALARSPALLRRGGRLVSVAAEPPTGEQEGITATYFVVEPNRDQLGEIARLIDAGELRPAIDAVYPLAHARAAFERLEASGKCGKVVLSVDVGPSPGAGPR